MFELAKYTLIERIKWTLQSFMILTILFLTILSVDSWGLPGLWSLIGLALPLATHMLVLRDVGEPSASDFLRDDPDESSSDDDRQYYILARLPQHLPHQCGWSAPRLGVTGYGTDDASAVSDLLGQLYGKVGRNPVLHFDGNQYYVYFEDN